MTKMLLNPEGYIPANDNLLWNQSIYFNLYDPQSKIGCFIRIGILENLKKTNNWFVFFKDGKPLYARFNLNLPYTPDRMDKGIDVAGIRVKAIEPLKKAHIEFSEAEFSVDLIWEALHPMVDCIALTHAGHSDPGEIGHLHMEGPCRVSGAITVRGGKRIVIDGTGFRDIGVGERNMDLMRHVRLAWPIFSNGLTCAVAHLISTSGQDHYLRMLHDGTEWLVVTKVEDRNEYEDDEMTLRSMHWKLWDARNRMWEFTAKPIFRWFFPFDIAILAEHMMEYRLSDGTVGYGLGECAFRLPWEGNGN